MAFAVIADIEAIIGRSLSDQSVRVERLITLASGLVSAVMRYTTLTEPTVAPAQVTAVTANAVVRVLANPTGVQSQSVGPFSESYGPTEPGLYLTAEEVADLTLLRSGRQSLYTIQTTPGYNSSLTRWVATDLGGDLVPFESMYEGPP